MPIPPLVPSAGTVDVQRQPLSKRNQTSSPEGRHPDAASGRPSDASELVGQRNIRENPRRRALRLRAAAPPAPQPAPASCCSGYGHAAAVASHRDTGSRSGCAAARNECRRSHRSRERPQPKYRMPARIYQRRRPRHRWYQPAPEIAVVEAPVAEPPAPPAPPPGAAARGRRRTWPTSSSTRPGPASTRPARSAARSSPTSTPRCAAPSRSAGGLQDPLSELVKIDPQHVGVGLYQHDVNPKHLQGVARGGHRVVRQHGRRRPEHGQRPAACGTSRA